jgi:cyclic pyranopterin phosphate synthase
MVDVSKKDETVRRAEAEGVIRMAAKTLDAIQAGETPKGSVMETARLAGIQAGKRTGDLIPLCHMLPGASLQVDLELDSSLPGLRARAKATYRGRTGVEMEALTAVSVALLTVYDMVKALDRSMELGEIRLVAKEGGQSGTWPRDRSGGES